MKCSEDDNAEASLSHSSAFQALENSDGSVAKRFVNRTNEKAIFNDCFMCAAFNSGLSAALALLNVSRNAEETSAMNDRISSFLDSWKPVKTFLHSLRYTTYRLWERCKQSLDYIEGLTLTISIDRVDQRLSQTRPNAPCRRRVPPNEIDNESWTQSRCLAREEIGDRFLIDAKNRLFVNLDQSSCDKETAYADR